MFGWFMNKSIMNIMLHIPVSGITCISHFTAGFVSSLMHNIEVYYQEIFIKEIVVKTQIRSYDK